MQPAATLPTARRSLRRLRGITATVCLLACAALPAQTVSMSGSLGDKALLVINGVPRSVATGATVEGVRLLSVQGEGSVVEIQGKRMALTIGATPVSLGGATKPGQGTRIVIPAGTGGHFITAGKINGKEVRLILDTGATNMLLSEAEAQRLGIDFRKGVRGNTQTANGTIQDHRVRLDSVQIGDVTVHGVEATIVPAPMTHVFAGNSFLTRFQMRVENDTLTLDKRY